MTTDTRAEYNYADSDFWASLCAEEDVTVLEDVVANLKAELADIDEERVLKRADWDEYAVEQHDPGEYRRAYAAYSRWKADMFLLHRDIADRKSQLVEAMRDRIGEGSSSASRTVISRLARGIIRHQTDDTMSDEDLYSMLDTTFIIAAGRKMSLRDMADNKWPW